MEIKDPKLLKQVQGIVKNMIANGQTKDAEAPVWAPRAVLAAVKRAEGKVTKDGRSIVFTDLKGDLALLNNKFLKVKGDGPVVKIAVAVAARDFDWTLERPGQDPITGSIKKGDEQIRCFA
jgi:hypothetical protein